MSISPIANAVVLENLHEAVFILDTHNKLLQLNPSAEKLLQKTIGRSYWQKG